MIFLNRPYILKEFNSRLKKIKKKIKRELSVVERIRLIEKVVGEDNKRIKWQKSRPSFWVTISKPKEICDTTCSEIDNKDIETMKEIEKEDRENMKSQIGWDRSL